MEKIHHLYCKKCGQFLFSFNKEENDPLVILHISKILNPQELLGKFSKTGYVGDIPNLACQGCGNIIGTPAIIEGKIAFFLKNGSFIEKMD